jgi:hypothetical protein
MDAVYTDFDHYLDHLKNTYGKVTLENMEQNIDLVLSTDMRKTVDALINRWEKWYIRDMGMTKTEIKAHPKFGPLYKKLYQNKYYSFAFEIIQSQLYPNGLMMS